MTFLAARRQRVTVDGRKSRDFDVTSGVPQGSCLGPILSLLFASRLFHVVKKHLPQVQGYADDTQLYLSFQRPREAEKRDPGNEVGGLVGYINMAAVTSREIT